MLFRLRNMILKQDLIKKAFSFYNGGKGLDHWSYSSTSTPFAKNIINYYFPQEVRRKFPFRYPGDFGNLVNNTVQKMLADVLYTAGRERLTDWDRSYEVSYQSELKEFHSKMPIDDKDKFGREEVLNYVEPCIKITEKAVKEIVGDNKLVCESNDGFNVFLKFKNNSRGVINYIPNGSAAFPKERLEIYVDGNFSCRGDISTDSDIIFNNRTLKPRIAKLRISKALAVCSALTTFGELPLPERIMSKSPGRPLTSS